MNYIDFTNPFLGRRWLLSLTADKQFGLSFKPLLAHDKDYMGFTFQSNQFGLRGPDNVKSDSVICGTSYGMGLSVDNGQNWYELSRTCSQFFNVSMPVGTQNHINRVNNLYQGDASDLYFIYHPNIWSISAAFDKALNENKSITDIMAWKTTIPDAILLSFRRFFKNTYKRATSRLIFHKYGRFEYRMDANYSYFDLVQKEEFANRELNRILDLFRMFKRVKVFRVPIKEQVYYQLTNDPRCEKLIRNYESNWNFLLDGLSEYEHVSTVDLCNKGIFSLTDYLPRDTHWSVSGNEKFSEQFDVNVAGRTVT